MTLLLVVLLTTYVGANLCITCRLARNSLTPFAKAMLVAMMWIAPFIGALVAFRESNRRPKLSELAEPLLPGTLTDAPPTVLQANGLAPFDLDAHMKVINGFPLLEWEAISRWISSASEKTSRIEAVNAAKRAWLMHMRDVLGAPYRLYESEHAYVLSSLDNAVTVATAAYVNTARNRVQRALNRIVGSAFDESDGKSILLVIDDLDTYYAYVACYGTQEDISLSSDGMFLDAGCNHVVVIRGGLAAMEPVITREIARDAVSRLRLPRWLAEGLAVHIEERFSVARGAVSPLPGMSHRGYWDESTIQEFWSGQSFIRPDGVSELSFELAQILVSGMAKDDALRFRDFVLSAQRLDAGRDAAIEKMNIDLGAYVCALLGLPTSEEWAPTPCLWGSFDLDVV